jgi:hypothetical protein
MSAVIEIEEAVAKLPGSDVQAFAAGRGQTGASHVDEAFEKAILSGRFDKMAARALCYYQTDAKPAKQPHAIG